MALAVAVEVIRGGGSSSGRDGSDDGYGSESDRTLLVPCPQVGDTAGKRVALTSISGFRNHLVFTGWGDWPHAQPPSWRARVFCQGVLPLATISRYLKGAGYPPFAVVAQLQCNCISGL